MTANQINFARHREDVRHNIHTERQKERDLAIGEANAVTNAFSARTGRLTHEEAARHNREQESINWFDTQGRLAETTRHNQASEELGWYQHQTNLQETTRHNLASESAAQVSNAVRSREADIKEKQAVAQENYWKDSARAALQQAENQSRQASVSERNLEIQRHQAESGRLSALASQSNAQAGFARANAAAQSALAAQRSAEAAILNAQTRSNELAESIRKTDVTLEENRRHNVINESVDRAEARSRARQADSAAQQADAASTRARNDTIRTGVEVFKAGSDLAKSIINSQGLNSILGRIRYGI